MERHRLAAAFYQGRGVYEEALYHWLAASAWEEAAAACELAGEPALRSGRLEAVAGWVDPLPPAVLAEHPRLQALLGDVCRLRSHFDEALAWYAQAERIWRARGDAAGVSRALHGQASVYLDTVRPTEAESLLQEALGLAEGIANREARARLLELLAENKLNIGKPAEAEALRAEAQALRDAGPAEDVLSLRVKLRTGQLAEARRLLEAAPNLNAARPAPVRSAHHAPAAKPSCCSRSSARSRAGLKQRWRWPARASLWANAWTPFSSPQWDTCGWDTRGSCVRPRTLSLLPRRAGNRSGRRPSAATKPPLRSATGSMCAGHGLRPCGASPTPTASAPQPKATALEPGLRERAAAEGIEIARWAGDVWVAALIELTLGASYVLAGQHERGLDVLDRALAAFRECGDTFATRRPGCGKAWPTTHSVRSST